MENKIPKIKGKNQKEDEKENERKKWSGETARENKAKKEQKILQAPIN